MLLLNLIAGKVTFLVVFHESHGINQGVNFLAADTFVVLGVVELLGTLGCVSRDRVATEGNIVVPIAQNGRELRTHYLRADQSGSRYRYPSSAE